MRRTGFSLIELTLAVGLSIALVALLGLAIDLHLVRLDSSRTSIEQAQLARAILDRVTADLRATTTAPPQDVSEQMSAAQSSAQFDVDNVDSGDSSQTEATETSVSTEIPVGLNGLIDTLTIDTRQLAQTLVTAEGVTTPVARIDVGWTQIAYGMSQVADSPGLVRTVTPRDAVRFRNEQGVAAPVVEPIAPEVRAIQFRYFDGTQLVDIWDMAERQALPTAVEVRLELEPADAADAPRSNAERQNNKVYRRVVRLAAAVDEAEGSSASAASSSAASTDSSGTGGSGGTF